MGAAAGFQDRTSSDRWMGCVPLFPDTVMAGRWPEEIRDQTAGFLAATFLSPLARSRARALLARSAAFEWEAPRLGRGPRRPARS